MHPLTKETDIDSQKIHSLFKKLLDGEIEIDDAVKSLKTLPYEDLGFAQVDHHRYLRQGFPEVVFGQGKTPEQIAQIALSISKKSSKFLVTRATEDAYKEVLKLVPEAKFNQLARVIYFEDDNFSTEKIPGLSVICAGTSDLPVALEASITAELMGCDVQQIFDIGVAGIHRLFDKLETIRESKVLVAGMEGALPSVIGGLVDIPIIAVPTSVGYGASFGGLSALLGMLNSCAPGISVVNIDNGFGAGYFAGNLIVNNK